MLPTLLCPLLPTSSSGMATLSNANLSFSQIQAVMGGTVPISLSEYYSGGDLCERRRRGACGGQRDQALSFPGEK